VGNDPATTWNAVCRGDSGVGPITRFNPAGFPTRIAAEVRNFDLRNWIDPSRLPLIDRAGRHIHFGLAAAAQAMSDSGLETRHLSDPSRFGVYLGSGEGAQDFCALLGMVTDSADAAGQYDLKKFTLLGMERLHPEFELLQEPNILSAWIAGLFGAEGPNLNSLTACAASAQAIGEGVSLIRSGQADAMIVGGAHSMLHPFGLTGFCLLTTLSTRNDDPTAASRPFDGDRDGFVLGEGAAMLVIEEYELARKRGAKIYGEIRGYGASCDAYRVTDIPEDGNGFARAIQLSLKDAGINSDDIDYVNAHGTSTAANDRTETQSLKRALGESAYKTPMSSTKSMTGHLVAACGALESMFSLLAIRDGIAPPTINQETPDPDCDLDYIPNKAREVRMDTVMSNNAGFGGQNVSLILSRV
jgi:3-oxoacyl-[acyl-carrier-protein] synthase II